MKIEDLIKQRKEHLNIESPPDELWSEIRDNWKYNKPKGFQWWKVAAVIFLSTSIGLLGYVVLLENKVDELATLSDISASYAVVEENYQQQIAQLESEIPLNQVKQADELSWVFEELEFLEEINKNYRSDIGKNVDQNQLIEALVDYYEKKLRLLKKLELELERTKKQKNEETNTILTHS